MPAYRTQRCMRSKMPETYFITGAQGCIGSWIVKALAERGDTPFVFDRSEDRRRLVHLAGLQVPTCKADPVAGAFVNVIGTLNLFEAARALGVERIVYASSA